MCRENGVLDRAPRQSVPILGAWGALIHNVPYQGVLIIDVQLDLENQINSVYKAQNHNNIASMGLTVVQRTTSVLRPLIPVRKNMP